MQPHPAPETLYGQIRSFGSMGPEYEIGQKITPLPDGDWLMQITLVQTGEKTQYPLSHIFADPLLN